MNLHHYQERAANFVIDNHKCALLMSMGLGKSLSTLTAIQYLHDHFQVHRVLIIAPKRVVEHTWPNEIVKWGFDLSFKVLNGPPAKRSAAVLHGKATVHLISRDLVTWLVDHHGKKWPYDMIVIDESSSFKNFKSRRFKSLKKVAPQSDRVVLLTGTPAPNSLMDIWTQFWLLDQGERLGKTITNFRNLYFDSDYMGWSWTLKAGAAEKIHAKVADLCLQMSAEDYLQMPDRIDNYIEVDLPDDARDIYADMERDFILSLESGDLPILSAAALVNKLLQCSNGAVYTDDTGAWEAVHDAKLQALDSVIEESAGNPVLIAYTYQSDLERIWARYKGVVDVREAGAIDAWNAGEIQIMVAHPASAGHGLNLQQGGNTIVWFGLPWSLELYQQFNARLHRQGQDRPVIVHHIMSSGTADHQVLEALQGKHQTQAALLEAVKQHAEERA